MDHGPVFYLLPWCLALLFALLACFFLIHHPWSRESVRREEKGRDATMPRGYRFGGVALIAVFLVFLLSDARLAWDAPLQALFYGALAIGLFSLLDDRRAVPWPVHLLLQLALGLLVFSAGMRIDLSLYFGEWVETERLGAILALALVLVWVVLVMNALNWVDGTDGLMPGVAALSFATLFALSLRPEVNQPAVGILAVVLFALSLALLFFNWHPAKLLAGTGGAYFFGFMLSALAIYAGTKVATALIVLAIPIFDAGLVILRRLVTGHSPFLPDRGHLHHRLLELGWGERSIALFYLLVTGAMMVLALTLKDAGKAALFVSAGMLLALFTGSITWWIHHHLKR